MHNDLVKSANTFHVSEFSIILFLLSLPPPDRGSDRDGVSRFTRTQQYAPGFGIMLLLINETLHQPH
jgi:hypothetical protein